VCTQLIVDIQNALPVITISGKNAERDRAFLVKKLTEALDKLDDGAFEGAVGKLIGFRGKVLDLLSAKRISQADAQRLIGPVEEAITCITELIEESAL
jgi:hypothetical protein